MRNARYRRVLSTFVAVVCAAVPTVFAAPSASAGVPDGRNIGVSFGGDILGLSAERIRSDFQMVKDMGATWVRVPFNWTTLEMHGRGQFNWAPADKIVYVANALGLKIEAVVSYAPAWARPASSYELVPPTDVNDYANFMAAAVRRYAPLGVHVWEIWNEPNLFAMWGPYPDVVKYTALLKAAYPKIKAVDPGAIVLTGGTSPAADSPDGTHVKPITFLRGIYANGGKGYFDAVAHHPSVYPWSTSYVADWNAFLQSKDLYAEMVARGDGAKRIWATEIGYPTGTSDRAVTEVVQGDRFVEALSTWKDWSFGAPIFIYSARDMGTNKADHYQNFGIANYYGFRKASYPMIQRALRAPQNVRATASPGGATVSWNVPAYDYGTPITEYKVSALPSGITTTVPGYARTANLNLPGGTYRFAVQPLHRGWPGVVSLPSPEVTVAPNTARPLSVYPVVGRRVEGDIDVRTLTVPVQLNKASLETVTVQYTTARWGPLYDAAVPEDYDARSGTVTFQPGQTVKNILVTVKGDTLREPDDKFLVVLSNPQNAVLGGFGGVGYGVIVNDD
jgi:polysaccharide biosynthesis protein PslG